MQALDIPFMSTCPEPEADLLKRIARSDEDALQAVYTAYGQRMYAYALRLTGDPATADETLQESLMAVWQGAGRFRGEGRVIAWLLGIVHHKAMNHLRKKTAVSLDDELAFADEIPAHDPLPEQQAVMKDRQISLKSGLEQLSMEHRTVLELVFYQGLSLEETAGVVGCPVGTVKSRLSYAKTSLRGALTRSGLKMEDLR
jgi:RNA polymerase sigma-70 factor (ECF subfamily)